jgi:hypothetical protein
LIGPALTLILFSFLPSVEGRLDAYPDLREAIRRHYTQKEELNLTPLEEHQNRVFGTTLVILGVIGLVFIYYLFTKLEKKLKEKNK